ncbi:MAG TPA: Asp-tRNA(Asn)/Glu-tRNA(Gln) amidotransferase subunit GatC [Candidatus Paceibacterota bacterium]
MSSSSGDGIGKKELEHLAQLSRIEIDPKEADKLITDLDAILDHFKELQALDTANVAPMTGGTDLTNVFRADGEDDGGRESTNRGAGVDAFPESKDGYLKVPPVFE